VGEDGGVVPTHSEAMGFAVILDGTAEVSSTPAVEVELTAETGAVTAEADDEAREVVLAALVVVVDRVVLATPNELPELSEIVECDDDGATISVTVVCTVVVVVVFTELETELVAALVAALLPVEMAEDPASLRPLCGITLSAAAVVVAGADTARRPMPPGVGIVLVEEMELELGYSVYSVSPSRVSPKRISRRAAILGTVECCMQ
jgi:hypothetical protein